MLTDHLSPAQAAAIARRGRELLRARQITHHQHSLLTLLLWGGLRRFGRSELSASYTRLADRAAMARATLAAALRRLEELGLVVRTKVRLLVSWGGGQASRQGTSRYRLVPATEFTRRPVPQELEIHVVASVQPAAACAEARQTLAAIAARRAAERDQAWLAARASRRDAAALFLDARASRASSERLARAQG